MKYCAANGLELVQIYQDPALSGSLPPLERPGLHALLEALKAGDIKQVIVTRLDRLARDTMLSLWLMKEIKKLGAELASIAEGGAGMIRPRSYFLLWSRLLPNSRSS